MKAIFATAVYVLATLAGSIHASENSVIGIWQTERGEAGGYLHVEFASCDNDVCGTIIAAYNDKDELGVDYAHLGKNMVWDMQAEGSDGWKGGKIWDPEKDKTYASKMSFEGDNLKVSGCIAFICRSQVWTRVE